MDEKENIIKISDKTDLTITEKTEKILQYDPEIKYYCNRCNKDSFPKYKRELDAFKFLFFMFFIFASFFLLLLILIMLFFRRFLSRVNKNKTEQTKSETKIKSREELSFLGLILPQVKKIICVDCGKLMKEESDSGDFILVCILFIFVILIFFVLRYMFVK